ncbi:MAG: hypothetical protein ABFS45_01270 [Pseudomonadota bacterium]
MVNNGFHETIPEHDKFVESIPGDKRKDEQQVGIALKQWQKAAQEWSEIYRRFREASGPMLFERKRQLRIMEKQLNDAADAYERARQNDNRYSLLV